MKIARIESDGELQFAVGAADGAWAPLPELGLEAATTADVIRQLSTIATRVTESTSGRMDPTFACPIVAPSKMLAIGLNYLDHIRETGATAPENPILFAKFPNALNGPYDPIVVDPELTKGADYEVELAVIIGEKARSVRMEDALDYVYGYTVANDVSARDWQRRDGQFSRSKSFDTFAPMGPVITLKDEIENPDRLALKSWVNGEARQDSSTSEMVFSVSYLIWYLARGMTLFPGDVILTGTPHGVGFAMDPPKYLAPGDTVKCSVEGLGELVNPVV